MVDTASPLAPAAMPLSPLALHVRRVTGAVVGRPVELAAIERALEAASSRLTSITVEGEPGIGKTRLLYAASELAEAAGFVSIAVSADEEIRGPLLLARCLFASTAATETALGSPAEQSIGRALDAIGGAGEAALEAMAPEQKLLRAYDLAAIALRDLAASRPIALLVDDLQWADEDSLRMLRYVVRTDAASPIFVMFSLRPEEVARVTEAVTLLADMERMGLVTRLRVARFTQVETAEFLRQVLGGQMHLPSAATIHAQAEGVPFILEELTRAYRDAGMLQQIDGNWSLARNAQRLVPSAVRTLIDRRSARLPAETKATLGEAAVLGRSFSLRDLRAVKERLGDEERDEERLAELVDAAVATGLLVGHPQGSAADYSFTHEQVRESAASNLPPARRRAIHAAIVDILVSDGDPPAASLSILADHALAAGDAGRAARYSIDAARGALQASAPEECLRLVERALPSVSAPQDRVALLTARDEALEMLGRSSERLEGLAELAALAEALGDSQLELSVMLRRAAGLRAAEEHDRAAQLARQVRALAADRGDRAAELAACLEIGQDLLRSTLGEGYAPSHMEADLDGAEEAFTRAEALAGELGDGGALAASKRELAVINVARARAWFAQQVQTMQHLPILQRAAAGEEPDQILPDLPIGPLMVEADQQFKDALELFEQAGDRHGVMSCIVGMAYQSFGAQIHLGSTAAERIEEIRRIATRVRSLTSESQRAQAEAQMLYGVHVFARAKVIPDLAISRGEEAYRAARALGDRALEFSAAGGTALGHLDIGDNEGADEWLGRAASTAAEAPTPLRARQLELWRGRAHADRADVDGMREHLERAIRLATEQGRPAGRCEALALLALCAARLGKERHDVELLRVAEASAEDAKRVASLLPGHPPWGAQADAALAEVMLARGRPDDALTAARSALGALLQALREDVYPEIMRAIAGVLMEHGTEEERNIAGAFLGMSLAMVARRTLDEDVRVRWFRGPMGRELAALVGPQVSPAASTPDEQVLTAGLDQPDALLLRLLMEGRTNREIADELGLAPEVLRRRLAQMYAKVGASSRGEATAIALAEGAL